MQQQVADKVWIAGTPALWKSHATGAAQCPGCHYPLFERLLCEVIEELGIAGETVFISGVGCTARSFLVVDVDALFAPHGRAPDLATAIKRERPNLTVVTWQGDGDTMAIGAGSVINAAARAEKFTVIMGNNANYGTTGGQLAPTTLMGQVTPTSPNGRGPEQGYPVHTAELLATIKGVAYTARGSLHTFANYQRTRRYIKKALEKQQQRIGFGFVEILSACPPCWHKSPMESLDFIEHEMIAEFPLGEFKNVNSIE